MNPAAPRAAMLPVEITEPITDGRVDTDRPWNVVVWNDPVNLMTYVVLVFRKLFGYTEEHATRLMLEVHHEGRSVVASGTREQAEHHVARLHAHGLWATTQRDS